MAKALRALSDPRQIIYLFSHLVLAITGGLLLSVGGAWLQALGLALLATGIAGYFLFVYVLVTQRVSDQLEILTRFGMTHVFPSRATKIQEEYEKRLSKVKDRIDILGFGLSALREDLGPEFTAWKSRARVRILLLDPDHPSADFSLADQRDRDEDRIPGKIRSDVETFLNYVHDLLDDRFQVRLYTCLPTVNIFRVDREVFWGPYLVKEQGRNTPTFVAREGIMFEQLTQHFDRIWKDPSLSRSIAGNENP